MNIRIKINIVNERGDPFMGPGPFRLLERIKIYKSINKAAKDMNLSYVKALSMLNRLERNVSRKLLVRKRGGNEGGGTELTPYALSFIDRYRELEERIKERTEEEYLAFVKNLEEDSK